MLCFYRKTVFDYKKYRIWNGSVRVRERERESEKREEEKESEEKGRRGKERHLPFGNGCGSGAH